MKDLSKALGTKQILSTVYHPQTDSQIERINQEVKAFLRYYVNYQQDDQTEQLSVVEFQYNDKKHLAIGYILFQLKFGWKGDLRIEIELLKLETFLQKLKNSKDMNRKDKRS